VKLLLDAHTFLWWTLEDERISPKAIDLIGNIENEIYFSVASAWEIIIKYQLGKLILPTEPEVFIPEHLEINQFSVLPISLYHAFTIRELPYHHKDPFDRMLVAQSKVENMAIISADVKFKKYDVKIVW
jgi:PIN domain nuclease of toxin-antitoxin system